MNAIPANSNAKFPPYISRQFRVGGQDRVEHVSTSELLRSRAGLGHAALSQFALGHIEQKLDVVFAEESFVADGFDMTRAIAGVRGPRIEVGGPTNAFELPLLATETIDEITGNHTIITNTENTGEQQLLLDSNHLPLKDKSMGIIIASALPNTARTQFFDEAFRALEDNGLLMYQGANDLDIYHVLTLGFSLCAYENDVRPTMMSGSPIDSPAEDMRWWRFVAQKQY